MDLAAPGVPADQEASARPVWLLQEILAVLKREAPAAVRVPVAVREGAVSAVDASAEGAAFQAADAAGAEDSAAITPTHLGTRAATGAASTTATSR